MTKEREALKLALEALDHLITEFRIHDLPYGSKAYTKGTKAIREIQAVLAQPEQLMSDQINYGMSVTQGGKRIDPMSIYKEPKQEPVACDGDFPEGFDASLGVPAQALRVANAIMCDVIGKREWDMPCTAQHVLSFAKKYATPPQRKPLTDEEIDDVYGKANCDYISIQDSYLFARAIEAAHGIKGEA